MRMVVTVALAPNGWPQSAVREHQVGRPNVPRGPIARLVDPDFPDVGGRITGHENSVIRRFVPMRRAGNVMEGWYADFPVCLFYVLGGVDDDEPAAIK